MYENGSLQVQFIRQKENNKKNEEKKCDRKMQFIVCVY